MSYFRLSSLPALGLVLVLSMLAGGQTGRINPIGKKELPKPVNEVIQQFPSNESMKTAWKVHWATQDGFGLYIQDAWFKRTPADPWIQILATPASRKCSCLSQRQPPFLDISYNFALCTVNKEDAGPFGKLLAKPGDFAKVIQEVRDRGVAWMDGDKKRRGQKLVLWATLSAANYRYILEYGFQDDGTITFRLGSTGHNYSSREWRATCTTACGASTSTSTARTTIPSSSWNISSPTATRKRRPYRAPALQRRQGRLSRLEPREVHHAHGHQ